MLIKNNTSLEYATIGMLIDDIMKKGNGYTHYVGQVEWTIIEVGSHIISIEIQYLKRYTKWIFNEGESDGSKTKNK